MKQIDMFGFDKKIDSEYTSKIEAPFYEPKNKKPHILSLVNQSKANRMINKIKSSSVTEDEKKFLIEAAKRHNVFNYKTIADYYAHSNSEMQDLMEQSALVIIDFNKAIQYGFVKLSEEITNQYLNELEDEK